MQFSFLLCAMLWSCLTCAMAAEGLDPAVLKKVKEATVFLRVATAYGELQGSGFYIRGNVVVTNAHVLGLKDNPNLLPRSIQVVINSGALGREASCAGKLLGFDSIHDLAYLQVDPACAAPLTIAGAKAVFETSPVFIFGFPFGELLATSGRNPALTVGSGSVSSLRQEEHGFLEEIQINGDLNPGNSGGPIVLRSGELIAVSVATLRGTQIGFAIPADMIKVQLGGRVSGITLESPVHESDGTFSFEVSVAVLDPLERIKSATLDYWTGKAEESRPLDPVTKLPTSGAPSDGTVRQLTLKRDPADGRWKGSVKHVSVPTGREFFYRPAWVGADGPRMVSASLYGDLRSLAVEKGAEAGAASGTAGGAPGMAGPVPIPVAPPGQTLLAATEEHSEKGDTYIQVVGKEEVVAVPKGLLQITTMPTGKHVFAIFKGKAAIVVFDPQGMKPGDEIPLPQSPVAMWSDDARIVAACGESRVVSIVDAEKLKPIRNVPLKDKPELVPIGVIGRAPDGSFMTTWQQPGSPWWDISLYQVSESGQIRFIAKGPIDWCTYAIGNSMLFCQNNFRGSPSGIPSLLAPGSTSNGSGVPLQYTLFGPNAGFHRDFAQCFQTFDRKCIVMPTHKLDGNEAWTYLATPDLKRFVIDFPGAAVAEVPYEKMLVSVDLGRGIGAELPKIKVHYISRSTGRIFRTIIADAAERLFSMTNTNRIPPIIYVPGHELLVRQDINFGDKGRLLVVHCGPVAHTAGGKADPVIDASNEPPAMGKVGKTLFYAPKVPALEGPAPIFKVKQQLEGMTIDAHSGAWTWTPTEAYIGKYRVDIIAMVGAKEIPVIAWTVTIE